MRTGVMRTASGISRAAAVVVLCRLLFGRGAGFSTEPEKASGWYPGAGVGVDMLSGARQAGGNVICPYRTKTGIGNNSRSGEGVKSLGRSHASARSYS